MFKKPSKRKFIIQRVLVALLATISVVVIVTVTIFFMLGYRLDSGKGRLEQGALLQFDSQPNGADVTVDGAPVSGRTATKQTTVAGTHTVAISKNGYETWNRTLSLDAGTLTWLDYVRLVPKVRTAESVLSYQTLADFDFSPDLKWALAQEKVDAPTFQLVDLRAEEVKSSPISLPASVYSEASTQGVTHAFTIYSWNEGGRYALMKHAYKDQSEWLMVDTQDVARSVNITRLLSVAFSDIQFAGTSSTSLFGLTTDGVVRKIDLSAGTLSRSLLTHVDSFTVFDANIMSFVGKNPTDTKQHIAGIYRDGEEKPWTLATQSDASLALRIATGRYYGDTFVAIANGRTLTVFSGSFPSAGSDSAESLVQYDQINLPDTTTALSISEKGDYIIAQSGGQYVSYEVEHKRSGLASLGVAEGEKAMNVQWLDRAHVWNDNGGNLVMRDFNGINAHTIMQVVSGYDASLSQNGRFMYGIEKTDTGYRLQRVKMILD